MSMNKGCIIGRLVRDPRLTQTNNQKACAHFTLAVDGFANAKGERQADFIPVTAWDKLAEIVGKYCTKGKQISIVGRLRTWKRDVNGETRYEMEVVAEQMDLLSSPGNPEQATSMATPASPNTCARDQNNDPDEEDEDLPF